MGLYVGLGTCRNNPDSCKKRLAKLFVTQYRHLYAEVVELVDTLDSGSSASNGVGVQVPSSAP